MKKLLRTIVKNTMDSYIQFECIFVRAFFLNQAAKTGTGKKKVLILRKDVIGDFILFIPTLRYYREYYKDAEISLVVNTVALELSSQFGFIDHIIPYDGKLFRSNFLYRRAFFHNLAKAGFDIVVHAVYSREYICDTMVRVTGAKETIAFRAEAGPMTTDKYYTRIIETPPGLTEPDRNMFFVSKVTGLTATAVFPNLNIDLFDHQVADEVLREIGVQDKKFVVLLPGAGAQYRTWQTEKFAQITDYLVEKHDLQVLLSGSKGDHALTSKIQGLTKHPSQIFNIAGKTDIPNFAHILNRSLFYFGSETGPLHLATAIGAPVVAILGGGHFARFFPYGNPETNRYVADGNAPCRGDSWKCSENLAKGEIAPCIRNINVSDAIEEIEALLAIIQR